MTDYQIAVTSASIGVVGTLAGTLITMIWQKVQESQKSKYDRDIFITTALNEIDLCFKQFMDNVGKEILDHQSKKTYDFIWVATQEYFIHYKANVEKISLIDDLDTRSAISQCYMTMFSIIDTFIIHNKNCEKYKEFDQNQPNYNILAKNLETTSYNIKLIFNRAISDIREMLGKIRQNRIYNKNMSIKRKVDAMTDYFSKIHTIKPSNI